MNTKCRAPNMYDEHQKRCNKGERMRQALNIHLSIDSAWSKLDAVSGRHLPLQDHEQTPRTTTLSTVGGSVVAQSGVAVAQAFVSVAHRVAHFPKPEIYDGRQNLAE